MSPYLEPVRRPDADAVAFFDPQFQQGTSHALGHVPQLAPRQADVLMSDHERFALAEALDGAAQVLADGLAEQRLGGSAEGIGESHDPQITLKTRRNANKIGVFRR